MSIDLDQFEERAAIMEFCGGLSRFEAETQAAKAQGLTRWQVQKIIREARNANGMGNFAEARDHREAHHRNGQNNLPGVQPNEEKQTGSMSKRDVQA